MGLHLVLCPAASCCSSLSVTSPSRSRPGPEVSLCSQNTYSIKAFWLLLCSLTIPLSYSVPGWSFRGGPGLFSFLCLSVHTIQKSWGCAGNTLLSGLVNVYLCASFRQTICFVWGTVWINLSGVDMCKCTFVQHESHVTIQLMNAYFNSRFLEPCSNIQKQVLALI